MEKIYKLREKIKFFLPYWKKGIIPVLFLFISTLISFVYPLFPKWAIDDIVIEKHHDKLIFLAILFMVLIIIQRLFSYLNEITFFKFQKNSILSIQKDLLRKVFNYPMVFFDKNHSGYLMGRIRGDVAGLSYVFSAGLVMTLMDFIKFFGVLIILLTINTKLTLISISILPFLVIKILNSKSEIKDINEKILEENARLEEELSDTLQGIEVLKSFAKEDEGIKRTEESLSQYQNIEIKRNLVLSKYKNLIDLIVHFGEVLLLYFGIREVIMGNLTIGGYIAFTGYLIFIYSPIKNLSTFTVFFDFAKRSYYKIKELIDILPEESGNIEIDEVVRIEVKNLSFSYNNKDGVIEGVNFDIKKGEKVLIVGESGSGKSTLIKLLLGLYKPENGVINYNGINMKEINLKKFREKVGYVSQNIFLFNKTIRENIIFESQKISDEKLLKVLKECKIDKYMKHEKGVKSKSLLDLKIAEKGANLSGGERQRIALVRAIIKDPDIIIIDEGTSNLDAESEYLIYKDILKCFKDKIIIIISHRFSNIISCDKIIYIDSGSIKGIGSHNELFENHEEYRELFFKQNNRKDKIKQEGL